MSKKYTRRRLRTMDQLDLEQERIRYKVKRMEGEWSQTVFNPRMIVGLAGFLLSRKSKSKTSGNLLSFFSRNRKTTTIGKEKVTTGSVRSATVQPAIKRIAKAIGVSFVQWQLFNISLFIVKRIFKAVKKKRS